MPVDLSQLSREELFAYKQAKSARDAARYKKKVETKQEAKMLGIPMIVPMKKRFQSDYEENYGDFNPNYQLARAEAKRLGYDLDEWKEDWEDEKQRLLPKKEMDEDPTEFDDWKGLLRNRYGDIVTKNYEWVGKLIVKIKGGKGYETIKRTTPPDYLQDTSLDTITEERFAEIVQGLKTLTPDQKIEKVKREREERESTKTPLSSQTKNEIYDSFNTWLSHTADLDDDMVNDRIKQEIKKKGLDIKAMRTADYVEMREAMEKAALEAYNKGSTIRFIQ